MEKQDIYKKVTDRIIAEMEQGRVPWVKPWSASACGDVSMPMNAVSKRAYSGINVFLLWGEALDSGYDVNAWLTFKQAREAGGHVRKGEKGTQIYYASKFIPKNEARDAKREGRDPKAAFFLKAYTVFNVLQCDNLPASMLAKPAPKPEAERIEAAEHVIKSTRARIVHGGNEACYSPELDMIKSPPIEAFHETEDYYRTMLHELGHWTGHANRLDRNFSGRFGSTAYAREELVAEMTAAFTSAACGIAPTIQHAAYLQSWLRVLKEDKKAIFQAASMASKAADYILQYAHLEELQHAA